MKRYFRLTAYVMAALALLGVTLIVPGAWAASSQRQPGQTVPSRTPTRPFVLTVAPTEAPTTQPPATQPPATAVPGATATPVPSPGATQAPVALLLTKQADSIVVWPGLDVTFTLTLSNPGTSSVREVVVEDTLPAGLMPGDIQSSGAAWDGRTLRARTPVLAPGGRFVVTFTAQVQRDLAPGGILVNQAAATATGGRRATAGLVLVLPPSELPPTGMGANGARLTP